MYPCSSGIHLERQEVALDVLEGVGSVGHSGGCKPQTQRHAEKPEKSLTKRAKKVVKNIKKEKVTPVKAEGIKKPEYVNVEALEVQADRQLENVQADEEINQEKVKPIKLEAKRKPHRCTIKLSQESLEKVPIKFVASTSLEKYRVAARLILTHSNATPINNHTGYHFRCCFCPEEFQKPADLKEHTLQQHKNDISDFKKDTKEKASFFVKLDITGLSCNKCKQSMSNIEVLIDHLNQEHGERILEGIKKLIFPFKFDINSDELRCCECSQLFDTFKGLQYHMHKHNSNFFCEECFAGFVNKTSLNMHKSSTHATGSFQCFICDKVFKNSSMKRSHEIYVHNAGPPKHVCRICNERFKDNNQKLKHMQSVHGFAASEYKCQTCGNVYGSRKNLLQHINNVHSSSGPFLCNVCDKKLLSKSALARHIKRLHPGAKDYNEPYNYP
ncbi:PR domain zinc finger protein 5-like isoform X13 [Phthorimaea operculella]|nr:PR domain zinc finger protein 5-like isoform X13 [Phthorimaea operculella]